MQWFKQSPTTFLDKASPTARKELHKVRIPKSGTFSVSLTNHFECQVTTGFQLIVANIVQEPFTVIDRKQRAVVFGVETDHESGNEIKAFA